MLAIPGRCFHLDPQEAAVDLGDEIEVWAVTEWDQYESTLARQPLDRGRLPQVTLLPSVERSLHEANIRSQVYRMARVVQRMCR